MGSIDGSPGSCAMKADETELRLEVERLKATVHVLRGRYEDSVKWLQEFFDAAFGEER